MAQSSDLIQKQSEQIYGTGETGRESISGTRYNPWILTCDRWSQIAQYIVLPINPGDVAWHVPLKAASEQTKHANVSYVWRNTYLNMSADGGKSEHSSMLQDFELALTFNSGNIAPMVSRARIKAMGSEETGTAWNYAIDPESKASDLIKFDEYGAMLNDVLAYRAALPDPAGYVEDYDPTVPLGVQNLYRLLSLADEPRVTYTQRGGTKANRVILVMNSPVFPQMSIYGHITPGGLSWEEGAEHPNSFDITLTLTVTDTWPKLGLAGLGSLLSDYRTAVDNNYNTRDGIYAVEQNGKVTSEKLTMSPTSGANTSKLAGNTEEEETLADVMTDINVAAEQIAKENGSTGVNYTNESALAIAKMTPKQLANMEAADAMAARAGLDDIAASWSDESKAKVNGLSQAQITAYANKMLANASADRKAQVRAVVADPTYTNIQKVVTINTKAATAEKARIKGNVASRIPGASRKGSKSA